MRTLGRSVLLLLTGALLGVLAMVIARPAAPIQDSSTPTEILRAIAELRSDVRALQAISERQHALPETPAGQPAALVNQESDPLLTRIDALQSSLDTILDRIDKESAESRAALTDLTSKLEASAAAPEPMPASLPDTPPNLQAFDRISTRPEDEVTSEHLLWTYEQVTDGYGRPTRVQPNPANYGGGIKLIYELPGRGTCVFWFKGGKCVHVYP